MLLGACFTCQRVPEIRFVDLAINVIIHILRHLLDNELPILIHILIIQYRRLQVRRSRLDILLDIFPQANFHLLHFR